MKDELSKQKPEYKRNRTYPLRDQHPNWKGGKHIDNRGYVMILCPDHPHARNGRHVCEHRLVMEKHLGRYLTKSEEVHHINGNKQDNRLENLQLLTKQEHRSIQRKGIHIDYSGRKCYECGSDKTLIRKAYPPYSATPTPNWYKHPKDRTQWCCRKCWYRLRTKI